MKTFYALHIFITGDLGLERVEAETLEEAYENCERNDSNLIILTEGEFNKLIKQFDYLREHPKETHILPIFGKR